ncbi:MAG: hypothetical protein COT73_10700 [Bdellovibrio sp. CG10_big_fil_rev_8_21_14_0_10_47_8]|nr:MAG: hypothetical protein COT73_10700 [Bdellovibrio sp. CG10_big_fil_rev_8_21_14_0_10_47_8]
MKQQMLNVKNLILASLITLSTPLVHAQSCAEDTQCTLDKIEASMYNQNQQMFNEITVAREQIENKVYEIQPANSLGEYKGYMHGYARLQDIEAEAKSIVNAQIVDFKRLSNLHREATLLRNNMLADQ